VVFEKNFTCPQLWERLVIGANGHVMLCANDEMESHTLGDVNNESLFDIWHGKKLTKAREIHIKHLGTKEIEPCKHCYLPRKMEHETADLGDRFIKIDKYANREQTVGK
jgi:radical SAM protein with 4Fe4S-binding SPASM domain